MYEGKVKTLTDKGFGFIAMGPGKKDLFFHLRELNGLDFDDLQVGDVLRFETEEGEKGLFAVNIERAGDSADA